MVGAHQNFLYWALLDHTFAVQTFCKQSFLLGFHFL
jgi:hypothetical protein